MHLRREEQISIHVPRVEDDIIVENRTVNKSISIHVPRVEDDKPYSLLNQFILIFQSTSPVWRTT